MSETAKHREIVRPYCTGNGADIGSGGTPVVPHAIQVELPQDKYLEYNPNHSDDVIQWRGSALDLPFKDGVLDFLHSSHLLEDFEDWGSVLAEWSRVVKVGGHLIIAVPDHERFRAAVAKGQGDNCSHKHESYLGELGSILRPMGYDILLERFAGEGDYEYSLVCVARKWK